MATMGGDEATGAAGVSSQSVLSYHMLKEVLQTSNIDDDEEAVMVTRMKVDPRHVKEFERILRLILKNTHTIGHVSTCVVKPPRGEYTYTSIVKYSSLRAMRQIYPTSVESGVDFYKLFAARDSLLLEPPIYQIEAGFGTWIESDGNTRPMRDDSDDCNPVYNNVPAPGCDDSCDNPHGLNVRASFVTPTKNFQLFQPRYQRNNKKGGQKNLRCFPCCRNGRHVSSGFCGDSIRVHVAVSRITMSGGIKICPIVTSRPAVVAFARFVNLEGAFDSSVSGPEVFPGQTIEKYEISQFVRDKEHPLNPLFPGILRGAAMESSLQSAIFEFNAECKAWHYGWTAPRGQGLSGSDAQHVLEILFMKPMGLYFFCLERLRSDTFSIYSSRRASHATVKVDAEVFENDDCDGRGAKRKRASHTPPSPASTVTSATCSTPHSAASTPTSWGNTQQIALGMPALSTSSPKPMEPTFKMEQTSPSPSVQQLSSSVQSLCTTGSCSDNHVFIPDNATDLALFSNGSTDLMSHTLFNEAQERRVVTTEELPWSELYNLFDSMPTITHGNETPEMEDESPVSSPNSTVETTSQNPAAVNALFTYL